MTSVSPPEPRRASLSRLLGLVFGALALLVVPAVAAAQEDDDDDSAPTTTQDGRFPTTSTNVLVTSPPPTLAPATTVVAQQVGRRWPVDVPAGCDAPPLPDVVFVGTVIDTDDRTGRFRIDQLRAGSVEGLAYEGLIDVRYGIDAKYLTTGRQYLVAASVDPATGVLSSRISDPAPLFGGDDVIAEAEADAECPVLEDPIRTLLTNGLPVDSSLLRPLQDGRGDIARAILVPLLLAFAVVFGLALLRWVLTGVGWGLGTLLHSARQTPAMRRLERTERHSSQPR